VFSYRPHDVRGYVVAQLVEALRYKPGSIPGGVTGIFQCLIPSDCTVALGSTQPLTEMSTRNSSWGWRRPVRRADKLTTFMCRLSRNSGASTSRNSKGLSRPVAGKLYLIDVAKLNENLRRSSSGVFFFSISLLLFWDIYMLSELPINSFSLLFSIRNYCCKLYSHLTFKII
jgi:hypothetical protein